MKAPQMQTNANMQNNRIENETGIRFAPLAVFFACFSILLVAINSLQYDCDKDDVFYVTSGISWFWIRFIAVLILCLLPYILHYQRWAMNVNLALDVWAIVLVLLSGNGGFMPTTLQWTLVAMLVLNIFVLVYENRLYCLKPQIHFSLFEIVKGITFVLFQWLNVAYTIHVTLVQNAYDVSVVRCIGRALTLVVPGKHFVTEKGLSAVPLISPSLDQMLSFGLMWCVIGTLLYITYGYLVFPRTVYETQDTKGVKKALKEPVKIPVKKHKKQAVGYVVDDHSLNLDEQAVTNSISEQILEKVAKEVAEEAAVANEIADETVVTNEVVVEDTVVPAAEKDSLEQSGDVTTTNIVETDAIDEPAEEIEKPIEDVIEKTAESKTSKKKKRNRSQKRKNRRKRASLHPDLEVLDEVAEQQLKQQDELEDFSIGTIMKPTVEEVLEDITEPAQVGSEVQQEAIVEMDPIKALVESLAQEVAQEVVIEVEKEVEKKGKDVVQDSADLQVETGTEVISEVPVQEVDNAPVISRSIEECIKDFGRNFAASKAFDKGGKVFKAVGCEGYIPYKIVGKEAIVCGGPICSYESLPIIMNEFTEFCSEKKVSMTFVNVSKQQANLMQAQGCSLVHSGAEPRFTLKDFKLKNSNEIKALKSKMKEKYGVSVSEYHYYEERDNDLEMAMIALNDDWLDDRNSDHFTMYKRRQRDAFLPDVTDFSNCHGRRYFYATNEQDELVAFIVLSPITALGGYSCEAGRKRSGQSRRMMELILHTAFIQLKESGAQWVSMGLMPDQQDRESLNPRQQRWQEFVYRYYERIFACKDYSEAKPKYKASQWEDVYIVTKEYQDMIKDLE